MNIGRDQINIENFKGNLYTGNIKSQNENEKMQQKNSSIEQILDKWGFRPEGISFGKREEKKADIEKWLRCFEPSELEDALLILEKIQYHDPNTVSAYIERLSKEIKKIFGDDLTKVKFYPLGESPSSSGGNFLYMFRKELGLSEASFPYKPIDETDFSETKAIVFFDDLIGSGNQAVTFARQNLQNITIDKYYISLLAFKDGYETVKKSGYFKNVIVHGMLSDENRAFSPNSQIFKEKETRERIKILCEKYGGHLFPKHPLGYDNSQALIVFPHNTPNNTLPIIWASEKNEKEPGYIWHPVWERIKKSIKKSKTDFVSSIKAIEPYVPDKNKVWEDLHRLTSDSDSDVRKGAASALGNAFSHVHDKNKVWEDLHRLTSDSDRHVRKGAADALGIAFSYVPDKNKVWEDLHRLTSDSDSDVRSGAAIALGIAFSHVPDKNKVWEDLHRLTSDSDSDVRKGAASALGIAFSYVPDKNEAWEDLGKLTSDEENDVRVAANHSFGKICITRAVEDETQDGFRKNLEKALEFFENASKGATYFNPAKFCLPFYRSFYMLTFNKEKAETEVQRYLKEAKSTAEDSDSKEMLLEAVENLGNVLKEAQNAKDFNDVKADLNAYRRYCDRVCELIEESEKKSPGCVEGDPERSAYNR